MSERAAETQDDEYRAFLGRGEVQLQQCEACGHFRPPTRWLCPECLAERWQWRRVSGCGTIETFVWYLQPVDKRFRDVPYNVALVRLDDAGVRVMGNVHGVAFGDLQVGQRVVPDIGPGYQGRVTLNFRLG